MSYRALRLIHLGASCALLAAVSGLAVPHSGLSAQTPKFADPAFERVWQRTDLPVAKDLAGRSWFWGPQPGVSMMEPSQAAGGAHLVQYFDKARMEINDPKADPSSPWYVTNGLLTVELVSGVIDGGPKGSSVAPPDIPLAADADDTSAPTYRSFAAVTDVPGNRGHGAASAVGTYTTATIDRAGKVGQDTSKQSLGDAVKYAYYEPATRHNIPQAFWRFLNSTDLVYEEGQTKLRLLSDPWFYATGYPISEAYWAKAKIAGQPHDVLVQAFQRRVLTYVPDNPHAWRVQMGNIGQHYYQWRYGAQQPSSDPTPTTAVPVPVTGAPGRIVFVSDRSQGQGIFTMNPDGSGIRQVAKPDGFNYGPRFSANGQQVAYVNLPPGPTARAPQFPPFLDPVARIMLSSDTEKADGTPMGPTSVQKWQGQADPTFSPSGMLLAFRGKPEGEQAGIFIANLASDAIVIPVRRVTSGDWDRQPAWSPDGNQIAFTSGTGADTSHIWLVNADGSKQQRLTDAVPHKQDEDPAWSPDGKTLVYASNSTTGKFEIFSMGPDGKNARSIVYADGGNLRYPSFSPDGKWLAFSSDKGGNSEILVAPADGSRWTNITNSPAQDTQPYWGKGK